jgi:hypothetical protein
MSELEESDDVFVTPSVVFPIYGSSERGALWGRYVRG